MNFRSNQFEITSNSKIVLSNFWDQNRKGKISKDKSKELLVNLFEPISRKYRTPIHISSVFRPPMNLVGKSVDRFARIISRDSDSLENLQIRHGHFNFSKPQKGFINIWYTGENVRPPLEQDWDVFLSFDSHLIDSRNFYFPFWLTGLENTVSRAQYLVDAMCMDRTSKKMPSKYASVVAGNPEPMRMAFINFLRLKAEVDIYGKLGKEIENKSECISQYKFNLAFENDLYPGYVTEKIFDAWLSKTIPIWRGLDSEEYLNREAFVDVTSLSFPDIFSTMQNIAASSDIYDSYVSSPILKRRFDFRELINKIDIELESNFQ